MIGYGKMPYRSYREIACSTWLVANCKSKSGREGEWYTLGLASQKNYISIYSCAMKDGEYLAESSKGKLGKASVGKSCIRYKKFEDIPWDNLQGVIKESQDIAVDRGIFKS